MSVFDDPGLFGRLWSDGYDNPHNPDPEQLCIGHGATTLMLKSAIAVAGETPPAVTRATHPRWATRRHPG